MTLAFFTIVIALASLSDDGSVGLLIVHMLAFILCVCIFRF